MADAASLAKALRTMDVRQAMVELMQPRAREPGQHQGGQDFVSFAAAANQWRGTGR